jgi:hypothetical protein
MTDVGYDTETLDTSDVDKHLGEYVGGGQLKEPVSLTDIRRWVQAMQYPNPRHFDEEAAAETPVGEIVAPQSFTVCCDVGEGMAAAIVGRIPNSHNVFGGDEWWFYGPHIRSGDRIRVQRRFDGYKIADTKFAGPTMFSRGDTLYLNERKEPVAKQRATAVRYLPELARKRGYFEQVAPAPTFSAEQLAEVERQKQAWILSGAGRQGPAKVDVGQTLPTRPIGPHTVPQFTIEYRSLPFSVWGSYTVEGHFYGPEAGWLTEMGGDNFDTKTRTGTEQGPSSGHTHIEKAQLLGLHRHYGYGASMGAWALDYVAYWAGDRGFIRHANIAYRFPVFEGDVSFVNGEVTGQRWEPLLGVHLATVEVTMTNQDGTVAAKGPVEVELPPS